MRLINKKNLIFLTSILLVIMSILVLKRTKPVELDEVKLLEASNNTSFAMYKEDGEVYTEVEGNTFPEGYVLNINKSKCIDNSGNEIKGVLSYEDNQVKLTSNKTSYCYLYFDESLGLEIKNKNTNGLKTDKIRGGMYRYQGQQADNIENYICFGTSDNCGTKEEDISKYMYRIIGIEAKTGRVKVIKKEALDDAYQWYTDFDTDVEFPNSIIYEAIKETGFLYNSTYIPEVWREKISNNTWMYGDMLGDNLLGANQTGEEIYKTESGQKETEWYNYATKENLNAQSIVVEYQYSPYLGETIYYTNGRGNWTKSFEGKVSLMYLHDYNFSVSDDANCYNTSSKYDVCRTGWMHLSQNDPSAPVRNEWTMSRTGYGIFNGYFDGHHVNYEGFYSEHPVSNRLSVRPVFYINASQTLKDGTGKIDDPFIIEL